MARKGGGIDWQKYDRLAERLGKAAALRGAEAAKRKAQNNIAAAGRIDTGQMITGIVIEPNGPMSYRVVSTAPHSMFQEKGVRPFGPKRPGGVLVFTPKGSGVVVFAKKSRGFAGIFFMERAVAALTLRDFLR